MTDPAPEPQPDEPDEPETPPADDDGDEAAESEDTPAEPEAPAEDDAQGSAPPSSVTLSEAFNRRRETELKRHERAMVKLFDEYEQDGLPCPVCIRPEAAPVIFAAVHEHAENGYQALAVFAGMEPEPPHREAENVKMCDRCDGYGELDYPTRNEHVKRQMCPACTGQGYVNETQAEQPPTGVVALPGYVPPPPEPPPAFGNTDAWGRAQGHPHFGIPPAQVGV
jgi:hypothetical protein